jgi:hypothetical protein
VAEVERGQVEEVGNQDDLAWPEMSTNPAHDETELHEVVEDVVAADIGTAVEIVGVGAPEETDVVELGDEDDNPVDGRDDGVQREWRIPAVLCMSLIHEAAWKAGFTHVLAPDGSVAGVAMLRFGKSVVSPREDKQQPGDNGQNLVGIEIRTGEFRPLGEGIVCIGTGLLAVVLAQRASSEVGRLCVTRSEGLCVMTMTGE